MSDYVSHRYRTDDGDSRNPQELEIYWAPNGDFYIATVDEGDRATRSVRFSTSGGCASRNPALLKAVHAMFMALGGWEKDKPASISDAADTVIKDVVLP